MLYNIHTCIHTYNYFHFINDITILSNDKNNNLYFNNDIIMF